MRSKLSGKYASLTELIPAIRIQYWYNITSSLNICFSNYVKHIPSPITFENTVDITIPIKACISENYELVFSNLL